MVSLYAIFAESLSGQFDTVYRIHLLLFHTSLSTSHTKHYTQNTENLLVEIYCVCGVLLLY